MLGLESKVGGLGHHSRCEMSKLLPSRMVPWLAAMVPIGLSACNQYEMFLVTGDEQVSFSGKVDVLFVIDNSSSVTEEASALLKNFDTFIDNLAGDSAYGQQTESLTDAVNDYITFTSNRAEAIDYNLAVVTPDLLNTSWNTGVDDPGEAGLFVGENPVVSRADDDEQHRFLQHVGCWSACWQSVETQATYTGTAGDCEYPDTESGNVSSQYLDCLCGDVTYPQDGGDWNDSDICHSASGESPIEASLLAMCRAVEDPPEICWHDRSALSVDEGTSPRTADWYMTNDGWLREGSKVVVIVVTDAADSSNTGNPSSATPGGLFENGNSADPTPYLRAFDQFDKDITFAFIGPDFACNAAGEQCEEACIEPAESPNEPGVVRMINLAKATGGFYRSITEGDGLEIEDPECDVADFSEHLEKLGELMINLQTVFSLRAVPDEESIRVYVDGAEIGKAEKASSGAGEDVVTFGDAYDNGWSYDPGQNAVLFWGDAIPDFNQDVEIFYRPIGGNPRSLPF